LLRRQGFAVSHTTVARLLRLAGYSLRTNRKTVAHTQDPDRDRQFRRIARQRRRFLRRGLPVLSLDTKKKEWIGNFKNPGRCWRREPLAVQDHDFASAAVGRAIPYGIYDQGWDTGHVVVGTSRETPEFAAAAVRRWWQRCGRWRYPAATRLLLEVDGGGANGSRSWGWKVALQRLADELRMTITVAHYPPGASKWNRIEHRLFNRISANWSGQPLLSYEIALNFIRTTRTGSGLCCDAVLDTTEYSRVKVTEEQKAKVWLVPHRTLPKWNYTIHPQPM
jgi:Rhodopirellula transposase DDE domain